jgi:phage terminase small subunit
MSKLNDSQIRFCEEYVIDWNGTRAYRVAYGDDKSENTIGVSAHQLLRNPKIKEHIESIKNDLSRLSGVTALRNVQELAKIAYSNMMDYKEDWMSEKEFNSLSEKQRACISEVQYIEKTTKLGTEKIVKFKLHDKIKAIEVLNKMLGYDAPVKTDNNSTITIKELPKINFKRVN